MMADKQIAQVQKFKQAARELDCDDAEEAFDAKLKAIAKQKPKGPSEEKTGSRAPTPKKR